MFALVIVGTYVIGSVANEAIKRRRLQKKTNKRLDHTKQKRLAKERDDQELDDQASDTNPETHKVHIYGRPSLKRKLLRSTKFDS